MDKKKEKGIYRKLKVLKSNPTHQRISELSLLLKEFLNNYDIDIYSKGSTLEIICDYIEHIIENKERFYKEPTKDNVIRNIEKEDHLDQILRESLPIKLYNKLKSVNEEVIEENNQDDDDDDQNAEDEVLEDFDEDDPEADDEIEEDGYSLYEEESDDEENEFSD